MSSDRLPWMCRECGNDDAEKFHTSWSQAGDADVICDKCGSDDTDEIAEARDEIERLRGGEGE